jgi:hypothetical protein
MITARIASLKEASAPAAVTAMPGDWPGPALNDFPYVAQIALAA